MMLIPFLEDTSCLARLCANSWKEKNKKSYLFDPDNYHVALAYGIPQIIKRHSHPVKRIKQKHGGHDDR
jgi:hypothetical protein